MLVAATVVLSGCSSFLDEENISSQSAEAFFATAKGYESLTVGAYETLNSIYNSTNYYTLTQLGTDIGTQGNGSVTNDLNQYVPTYMNDNGAVNGQWNALYGALKNINAAINRAPAVVTKAQDPLDGIDETLLATRVAEMKFLRALVLFEIVKNWGQAPLLLEEPTSASTVSQLDSGDLFYKQILQDLGDVISSNLPLKQPASDYGRASKAAAYHLRALVYLTRGYQSYAESTDFANALADAEYVIEKSGHALQPDFLDVHKDANEENDEIIFAVNYDAATNYNRNIYTSFWMFPYREGFGGMTFSAIYGADWGSVMPTKYAYLLFDWKKDRRAQVTFMSPLNGDAATSVDGKTTSTTLWITIPCRRASLVSTSPYLWRLTSRCGARPRRRLLPLPVAFTTTILRVRLPRVRTTMPATTTSTSLVIRARTYRRVLGCPFTSSRIANCR